MQRSLSLQARLVILVVAALLPLAALSVWFSVRQANSATAAAGLNLKLAATLVAANQDRLVESAQHLLAAISVLPQGAALDPSACQPYFDTLRGRYPIYANIGVIDPRGNVLCHASGRRGDFTAADRSYFRQALAERGFVMGEPIIGRASNRFVIPFAQPILRDAQVAAVAFVAIDLSEMAKGLQGVELPPGTRMIVTDRAGTVLIERPARATRALGRRINNPAMQQAARAADGPGSVDAPDSRGVQRLYGYAPSRRIGTQGFLAVVSVEKAQATAAADAGLHQQLVALGLMLLLGLAAAWWIGRRAIVHPTRQLVGAVRRLERGELTARVPMQGMSGGGEFGRIGAAFNLMAQSLEVRQDELKTELGRSRSAYDVLDMVLNSLEEGLIAVSLQGQFLMFNQAATRVFALEGAQVLPEHWARHFGMFQADRQTLYQPADMPLARALRGESGSCLVYVRSGQVPQGRLLQCSFRPMRADQGISGGLLVFTDVTEARKIESDLVLLRKAVAWLNDIVMITEAAPVRAPGPRIVFVNEAFERQTGYTAQETIGRSPRMLQGPRSDRAALDRIRTALEHGRPVREELVNYAKDGREFWVELDIVPLADDHGVPTHWISVERDITARKEADRALLDSQRELQDFTRMLQRTAEAAQAITANPTIEGASQAVADHARGVVGVHLAALSLTQDSDWRQVVTAMSVSDRYGAWRDELPTPDGSGVYAEVCRTGRPLRLTQDELPAHPGWRNYSGHAGSHPPLRGLLVVPLVDSQGRNIGLLQLSDKEQGEFTERDEYAAQQLAQLASTAIEKGRLFEMIRELNAGLGERIADRTAELAQQEQLFRTLAQQAPEVIWNTDASGERLTFLNRAWYALVGGTPDDWLGKSGLRAVHPDDRAEVSSNWRESRATQATFNGVRRLRAADGSYHTMSYKAAPVLGADGQVAFWVGIDSDITEFKAIESALRSANHELEAFSYSVSHDLRAPLGAIAGFSHALASKLEGRLDERSRHYLDRIRVAVGKMEQLIDALLSLSKVVRVPLRYVAVDLGALARESFENLEGQNLQRKVVTRVEDGLTVQGDLQLLRVMLANLIGNAWKFSAQQPQALIEVGRMPGSEVFFVRDNGVGFDMAYAGKLFTAFQRLHSEAEFPGTGIGLATVQRIVARHQGRVWVESQPGLGTTFFFTLSQAPAAAWPAQAPAGPPVRGRA